MKVHQPKTASEGTDIYSGPDLRYFGVNSEVLKILSASCGRAAAELNWFDAVAKRRWICRC